LGLNVSSGKLIGINGTFAGGTLNNGASPAGFAALAAGNDLTGVLGLAITPTKSDTRILSVPTITTTHNKEATIFVGESRPVVTGTQSTASGTSGFVTSSTVSQRDIGINLKVLPLIGKDGSVQLQISQQVEDVLREVLVDNNSQPVIGRRTTDSFVSAMSGEIIVLGGLQRTIDSTSANRLGPIPIIGDWLGSSKKSKTRTELVILMRPYVLNNSAVDNINALSRIDATPIKDEVRKIIDVAPTAAPAAPVVNP